MESILGAFPFCNPFIAVLTSLSVGSFTVISFTVSWSRTMAINVTFLIVSYSVCWFFPIEQLLKVFSPSCRAFTSILLLMRFPFLSITVVFCRELSSHSIFVSPYSVFTWENSHRREFHTGITFWFRIAFTWWLGHFIPRYLKVHLMTIKYTCDSKLKTLRMRYPFQSTDTPVSHRNGWSFRVYMIQSRDFVPEWKSHPGTRTGLHSRRGDSRRYDILWWYHVNKYRAMRGNRIRSKLALG